ncbi:MAG TPA: hypothetical protein VMZ04_03040, partial [Anaerolineae bacterium]|nr:hypothetical protein [Anaerolineae bacterium]
NEVSYSHNKNTQTSPASEPDSGFFTLYGSDTEMTPGIHRIVWSGHDEYGQPVASGMYITRLRMGSNVSTGRMMLVR